MKPNTKSLSVYILYVILVIAFFFIGLHLINAMDHNYDAETDKINIESAMSEFEESVENRPLKFEITKNVPTGLTVMLVVVVAFTAWIIDESKKQKMPGGEYGTAKWHKPRELKKYWAKDNDKNIILTQQVKFAWDNEKTGINMNTLCIGSAGSGKTFKFFKPNIMNCYGCYIIVDPKLDILSKEGNVLKNNGYDIKLFNIDDLANSNYYNPLEYIYEDKDVIFLVKSLLLNTKADRNSSSSDGFWDDASELLLLTLISYVKYCYPKEGQTIPHVLELMLQANEYQTQTKEGKEKPEEITLLDQKIEELEKNIKKKKEENPGCKCPESVVIEHYKGFKLAPKKTSMSILISVMARLKFYNIETVRQVSIKDEMELNMIGKKKMAIFISIPPTDRSTDFLSSIMFTQILKIIEKNAKESKKNKLDMPTRIMIDEAKNVGKIPNIVEAIAYVRSFDAGITLVYQSLAQLQEQYDKEWKEIIDNCDSFLFLKGSEVETTKYISDKLGNTTIYTKNRSVSKGSNSSYSDNEQGMGRKLMEPDEVGKLKKEECILFVEGKPYFDSKYNTLKHPRIKETCEYHPTWLEKRRGFVPAKPLDFKKELQRKRKKEQDILLKSMQYNAAKKEQICVPDPNHKPTTIDTDAASSIEELQEALKNQVEQFITEDKVKVVNKPTSGKPREQNIEELLKIIQQCIDTKYEDLKEKSDSIDFEQLMENSAILENEIEENIKNMGFQLNEEIRKLIEQKINQTIKIESHKTNSAHSGQDKLFSHKEQNTEKILSIIQQCIEAKYQNAKERSDSIDFEQLMVNPDILENEIEESIQNMGYQINEEIQRLIEQQITELIKIETHKINSAHSGQDKQILNNIVDTMQTKNDPPDFLKKQVSNSTEKDTSFLEQLENSGIFEKIQNEEKIEVETEEEIDETNEDIDDLLSILKSMDRI